MENWQILLVVVGVIVTVLLVLLIVLPFLKRRGVDVAGFLGKTKGVITAVDEAFDTVKPFLPASPGLTIFDQILAAAAVGVGKAEQLYYVGELQGGQRKQEAEAYIMDVLELIGIEITPEVERLVDGAIEAEVLCLGHGTGTLATRVT